MYPIDSLAFAFPLLIHRLSPVALIVDLPCPPQFLHEIVNLAPLLLLSQAVWKLRNYSLIDLAPGGGRVLTDDGEDQIQVVLLVETPLADSADASRDDYAACNTSANSSGRDHRVMVDKLSTSLKSSGVQTSAVSSNNDTKRNASGPAAKWLRSCQAATT